MQVNEEVKPDLWWLFSFKILIFGFFFFPFLGSSTAAKRSSFSGKTWLTRCAGTASDCQTTILTFQTMLVSCAQSKSSYLSATSFSCMRCCSHSRNLFNRKDLINLIRQFSLFYCAKKCLFCLLCFLFSL